MLNKGNVPRDSRFQIRDVQYLIRDSLGKHILASWFISRNSKEAMDVSDAFVTTITKAVAKTPRNECYVDLDFDWVNFPDGTGVQSVRASTDLSPLALGDPNMSAFIPIPSRFDDIYRSLPAQSLEGQIGWALRAKRIWFTTLAGQNIMDLGITQVDIDAVSTSENVLGEDVNLPIPGDVSFAIIQDVLSIFGVLMGGEKDMTNNNNSNIVPLK